jgi:hypothetical protein
MSVRSGSGRVKSRISTDGVRANPLPGALTLADLARTPDPPEPRFPGPVPRMSLLSPGHGTAGKAPGAIGAADSPVLTAGS